MQNKEADLFEYTDEWFRYGFIDCTFVNEQAKTFADSTNDDTEEFKWSAYLHILARERFTTNQRRTEFLELIDSDPNDHLWKGAIAKLIEERIFDESWESLKPDSRVFEWPLLEKKLKEAYQGDAHNGDKPRVRS